MSLFPRSGQPGPVCRRAGQQPVRRGEPGAGGLRADGPRPRRAPAQAPHQGHLPPRPLLLHPRGQGERNLVDARLKGVSGPRATESQRV